jgi:hypothetical protein
MKEFFEKHKTWFFIGGGIIGLYYFYQWYQGYAANQTANNAANEAAQDEAAQQAIENSLASQQSAASGGSGTTASSPGLININSPTSTPVTTGASPSGSGSSVTSTSPFSSTIQSTPSPVAPANVSLSQGVTPGTTGTGKFGGPGTSAAQAAALKAGDANPSAWGSDAFGSFNYTLNEAAAESEPGYNQGEFDQYWNSLTLGGTGIQNADNVSTPAFIAYEGSDPTVVNETLEAQGLPPAFILPTTEPTTPTGPTPVAPSSNSTPTGSRPSTLSNTGIVATQSVQPYTSPVPTTRLLTTVLPSTGNGTNPPSVNTPTAPVRVPVTPVSTPTPAPSKPVGIVSPVAPIHSPIAPILKKPTSPIRTTSPTGPEPIVSEG